MRIASTAENASTESHSTTYARRVGTAVGAVFIALSAAACSAASSDTSPGGPRAATTASSITSTDGAAVSDAPVAPSGGSSSSHDSDAVYTSSTTASGTALAALAKLPVKGRAPKTGYTRAQFGPAWTDDNTAPLGHNGCDTRNDIIKRDMTSVVFRSGHCVVASGTLLDPYTGKTIHFVRGPHSAIVQIDHVVALSDDWQKGAQKLSAASRRALANDPLNLIAADGPANEQKSDSDAASWLPANKAFRCMYVARQIAVKGKYHLWVTSAEKAAMSRVLAGCKSQPLPTATTALRRTWTPSGSAAPKPVATSPKPSPTPGKTSTTPKPSPSSTSSVYYANCDAVRAAGKAPLHRGDPGYETPRLDRDGDGVACE